MLYLRNNGLGNGRYHFTAAGADIPIGSTVAADVAVADRRNRAELNRDSNADVLRDGENAVAIVILCGGQKEIP